MRVTLCIERVLRTVGGRVRWALEVGDRGGWWGPHLATLRAGSRLRVGLEGGVAEEGAQEGPADTDGHDVGQALARHAGPLAVANLVQAVECSQSVAQSKCHAHMLSSILDCGACGTPVKTGTWYAGAPARTRCFTTRVSLAVLA